MANWSDPYQNSPTVAQEQAAASVLGPSTAPVVHAIIQGILHAQMERNKAYEKLAQGVGQGTSDAIAGYLQQSQRGQADDAANAAIYGQQYPNDPYGGFNDPNKVPDYGGTSALRAEQIQNQIAWQNPNMQPQISYSPEGIPFYSTRQGPRPIPAGDDPNSTLNQARQARIEAAALMEQFRQQEMEQKQLGSIKSQLEGAAGATDKNVNQVVGGLSGYQAGKTPFPTVEGTYLQGNDTQGNVKDAIINARQAYLDQLDKLSKSAPKDQPSKSTSSSLSAQDQQALDWAKSHPDDPRAQKILSALGQ